MAAVAALRSNSYVQPIKGWLTISKAVGLLSEASEPEPLLVALSLRSFRTPLCACSIARPLILRPPSHRRVSFLLGDSPALPQAQKSVLFVLFALFIALVHSTLVGTLHNNARIVNGVLPWRWSRRQIPFFFVALIRNRRQWRQ